MHQGSAALPGPVHPDAQIDPARWLAREGPAGLGPEPVSDRVLQRPGQDGQAARWRGEQGGAGGGLVVGMAGDAGVVEDQQALGAESARPAG